MRFVRYDESRLGLLSDDGVVDITDRLDLTSSDPLVEYVRTDADATPFADEEPDVDLDEIELDAPVRRPGKIVAAPGNYMDHQEEMVDVYDEVEGEKHYDEVEWTIEDKGYFLKAPSSIVGPGATVEVPFSDRRCDHEIELAYVMGESIKDVSPDEVRDAILGYTMLLDISIRGDEDRSNRKSYDSFTVVGPAVVTPDEIANPLALDLRLAVNGDVRQDANTRGMIYGPAEFAAYASIGTTIEAGDLLTTGTPPGVNALRDGDRIDASVEDIGEMSVDVSVRDVTSDEVRIQSR